MKKDDNIKDEIKIIELPSDSFEEFLKYIKNDKKTTSSIIGSQKIIKLNNSIDVQVIELKNLTNQLSFYNKKTKNNVVEANIVPISKNVKNFIDSEQKKDLPVNNEQEVESNKNFMEDYWKSNTQKNNQIIEEFKNAENENKEQTVEFINNQKEQIVEFKKTNEYVVSELDILFEEMKKTISSQSFSELSDSINEQNKLIETSSEEDKKMLQIELDIMKDFLNERVKDSGVGKIKIGNIIDEPENGDYMKSYWEAEDEKKDKYEQIVEQLKEINVSDKKIAKETEYQVLLTQDMLDSKDEKKEKDTTTSIGDFIRKMVKSAEEQVAIIKDGLNDTENAQKKKDKQNTVEIKKDKEKETKKEKEVESKDSSFEKLIKIMAGLVVGKAVYDNSSSFNKMGTSIGRFISDVETEVFVPLKELSGDFGTMIAELTHPDNNDLDNINKKDVNNEWIKDNPPKYKVKWAEDILYKDKEKNPFFGVKSTHKFKTQEDYDKFMIEQGAKVESKTFNLSDYIKPQIVNSTTKSATSGFMNKEDYQQLMKDNNVQYVKQEIKNSDDKIKIIRTDKDTIKNTNTPKPIIKAETENTQLTDSIIENTKTMKMFIDAIKNTNSSDNTGTFNFPTIINNNNVMNRFISDFKNAFK